MRARDEHTFLGIRIDSHEIAVGKSVNSGLRGNPVIQHIEEDSPVFTSDTRIDLVGTCTFPEAHANEKYELVIHGRQSWTRELRIRGVRVRGKDNLPAYRQYGNRRVPVYECPIGFTTLDRIRGANTWHATLSVPESTASDILAVLAQSTSRPIYISIHVHQRQRERWIQDLSIQTKNPADE